MWDETVKITMDLINDLWEKHEKVDVDNVLDLTTPVRLLTCEARRADADLPY